MHTHLIDWFRNVQISPDPKVVQKRWNVANEYADALPRGSVVQLLRLFLFPTPNPAQTKWFTDALLALDSEFPVAGNTEELRLMAGVVMVTAFAESSCVGDAFALGLRAAVFADRPTQPAQPSILAEAETYLRIEAERQRPTEFEATVTINEAAFTMKYLKLREAEEAGNTTEMPGARTSYHKAVADAIRDSHSALAKQVRRLAEETALLWWVLAEYSPSLKRRTSELEATSYALVAATEASDRTHILPPPPSAAALLARALTPCKSGSKENFILTEFLAAADSDWRTGQLQRLDFADCIDSYP